MPSEKTPLPPAVRRLTAGPCSGAFTAAFLSREAAVAVSGGRGRA
jgi:hypothetical protein